MCLIAYSVHNIRQVLLLDARSMVGRQQFDFGLGAAGLILGCAEFHFHDFYLVFFFNYSGQSKNLKFEMRVSLSIVEGV